MKTLTTVVVDDLRDGGISTLIDALNDNYYQPLTTAMERCTGTVMQHGIEHFEEASSACAYIRRQSATLQGGMPIDLLILDVQLDMAKPEMLNLQDEWIRDVIDRQSGGLRGALLNDAARLILKKKAGWLLWSEVVRLSRLGAILPPRRIIVVSGSDKLDADAASTHAILNNSGYVTFESKAEVGATERQSVFATFITPVIEEIVRKDIPRSALVFLRERLQKVKDLSSWLSAVTQPLNGGWTLMSLRPNLMTHATPGAPPEVFGIEARRCIDWIDELLGARNPSKDLYLLRRDRRSALNKLAHPGTDATWLYETTSEPRRVEVEAVVDDAASEIRLFADDPEFERFALRTLQPLRRLTAVRTDASPADVPLQSRLAISTWLSRWTDVPVTRLEDAMRAAMPSISNTEPSDVSGWVTTMPPANLDTLIPASFKLDVTVSAIENYEHSRVGLLAAAFVDSIHKRFAPSRVVQGTIVTAQHHESGYLAAFAHCVVGHDGARDDRHDLAVDSVSLLEVIAGRALSSTGGALIRAAQLAAPWVEVRLVSRAGTVNLQNGQIRRANVNELPEVIEWLDRNSLTVALVSTVWICRPRERDGLGSNPGAETRDAERLRRMKMGQA
ncbi:MAG TPA: hypothetical protein VF618_16110 [Thermoanaerobaculia bacterium]